MKRSLRIALTLALALAVSTASAFATVVSASFNKINIEVDGGLKAVSGEYFVRTTGDVPYSWRRSASSWARTSAGTAIPAR